MFTGIIEEIGAIKSNLLWEMDTDLPYPQKKFCPMYKSAIVSALMAFVKQWYSLIPIRLRLKRLKKQ